MAIHCTGQIHEYCTVMALRRLTDSAKPEALVAVHVQTQEVRAVNTGASAQCHAPRIRNEPGAGDSSTRKVLGTWQSHFIALSHPICERGAALPPDQRERSGSPTRSVREERLSHLICERGAALPPDLRERSGSPT